LQHAPCPGAIQDAAAVYSHVVINRMGAVQNADGTYSFPTTSSSTNNAVPSQTEQTTTVTDYAQPPPPEQRRRNVKVVLIGDSAGGNLVLGVSRWIRDEGVLPPPDGLLLLSPSCDPCGCHVSFTQSYL
jgi:hypothetical protein